MSLLQEALKRKEQDASQGGPQGGAAPGTPGAAPSAPGSPAVAAPAAADNSNPPSIAQGLVASLMQASSPPQSMPVSNQLQAEAAPPSLLAAELAAGEAALKAGRRKTTTLWVIAALIAVFIGATLIAGFAYFLFRAKPSPKTAIVPPAAVAPAGTNQVDVPPVPATAGGAEAAAVTQVTPTAAAQPPAAGVAGPKPAPAKPVARPKAPAAAAPVKWPLLKISGILRGSGKEANTALINGKMVNVGQTIENVTLIEIQTDGVILKLGEEKKFVRVGAISY